MSVTAIVILLVLGIMLMLLEVLVVPGVGVAGILGFLLMAVSIYLAYDTSEQVGHYVLAGGGVASIGLLFLSLRAKTWDRVSLKSELKGKSNNLKYEELFNVGDTGKTISRCNPIGKARINEQVVEVRSYNTFIDDHTEIEIVKLEGNKITVKPKTS